VLNLELFGNKQTKKVWPKKNIFLIFVCTNAKNRHTLKCICTFVLYFVLNIF